MLTHVSSLGSLRVRDNPGRKVLDGEDDVQSEHCWEEASGHVLASAFGVCLSLSYKSHGASVSRDL